jgi:hypothetical protein
MKAIVVLLGLGVVVVALAGGLSGQFATWYTDSHGVVHERCWSGCGSGPKTSMTDATGNTLPDTPEVEDVVAIHTAELSTNGDEADLRVLALVDRGLKKSGRPGGDLIRHQLPPLAAKITSAMPTVRERVLSLKLRTPNGESCRNAVLRMVARTESLYRTVSSHLAANLPPANVISEVLTGEDATIRLFTSDLEPCLAGLDSDSRSAVRYVLRG